VRKVISRKSGIRKKRGVRTGKKGRGFLLENEKRRGAWRVNGVLMPEKARRGTETHLLSSK